MADNRIAYGLAKKHGIDTKGMSPKEVWEALKGKGITPESVDSEAQGKQKELENKYNQTAEIEPKKSKEFSDDFNEPFAGGILEKKEHVEEYTFTGSKFADEEADVYLLKDGTKIIFQSMGDEYYQKITPQQAIRVWNKIPNYLKRFSQKEIEFVDYYNPDDIYWQKVYANFEHSFATSGKKITFYRNNESSTTDDQLFTVLCHEIGHNFDRQLFGGTNYKEWENIINKDGGNRVSEYAKNHIREDFADSVAFYVIDPNKFKKDFPNRFNFMEKWLKGAI